MNRILRLMFLPFLFLSFQALAQPHYQYLTYLPQKYDSTRHKQWPLIIYLHGKSACGSDLDKVRRYGLPFFTDKGMQLDAVAVSPQCPLGKNWTSDNWLDPFLKEVTKKYRIDTCRIYLTGMSLGGFGTWGLAIKYPHRFAAIAPLCGGGKPQFVCAIKDVPVWALHGDQDEQVPIRRSEEMIDALRKCGGNPKFTVLKGFPHDIHRTYGDENLYKWMLQYSLNKRAKSDDREVASNDTVVKTKASVVTETKVKTKKRRKSGTKAELRPQKQVQTPRRKASSEAQTDTLKGKDFILVF